MPTRDHLPGVFVAVATAFLLLGMIVSLVPVTANVLEPTGGPFLALQESSSDVAVTSIVQLGPPFANEGDVVVIQVGVANHGNETATFQVELVDDTANETVAKQEATLDGMATSTLDMQWNTTGASGGPPPPGPPTPGTIHALTARVRLEGDSNSSNNSMSLSPGIWIIAAPEPDGITFPESGKSPEAISEKDIDLEEPTVTTVHRVLAELLVVSEAASASAALANREPATPSEFLSAFFSSETGANQGLGLSAPGVSTAQRELESILASTNRQPTSGTLVQPIVSTVAVPHIPVRFSDTYPHFHLALSGPQIITRSEPLEQLHFRQSIPYHDTDVAAPGLAAASEPLAEPFGSAAEAKREDRLADPKIGTDAGETNRLLTLYEEAGIYSATLAPGVKTRKEPLQTVYHIPLSSDSSRSISPESVPTLRIPSTRINAWTAQSLYKEPVTVPETSVTREELAGIFWGGIVAPFQPSKSLQEPFTGGSVKGRVLLQGSENSLGAYVEIEGEVAFVDRDGYYVTTVPDGLFDLYVRAPGHLSATVQGIQVESGQTLQIPTVTLPFGDANGDELVDLYDLTAAARNYGQTTVIVSIP